MLGFGIMKNEYPVFFDVTHALQMPGGRADSAVVVVPRSPIWPRPACSRAGWVGRSAPRSDNAKCDGPCALRLNKLEPSLPSLQLDDLVKNFPPIETA
ncbi:hypothetical protein [Stutzerimonas xanthomarina]